MKMIFPGRKAFFFTVIAIYLVALLVFSSSFKSRYDLREKSDSTGVRIMAMNDFMKDVKKDLERGLYISSFRTILGLEEYVSSHGVFLNSTSAAFSEAFFNSSINNYPISLLEGSSFSDWTERISEHAGDFGINISINVSSVSISQSSPWSVDVTLNASILADDTKKTASWNITQEIITVSIPIDGFEDSLYTINSYGRVINVIRPRPADNLNFTSGNDTTVLFMHLNNSYYTNNEHAPNFIMRLEGDLSPSPQGIESLVDISKFMSQGLPAAAPPRSIVDYIYFSTTNTIDPTDRCIDNSKANPNLPSWFRLDSTDEHVVYYEITGISKGC